MARPAILTRLVALVILVTGPALVLLADSDRGPWDGGLFVYSLVPGFPLVALFCSALAFGLALPTTSIARQIAVALGAPAVLLICGFAALPILYGLGESSEFCSGPHSSIILAALILPAAAFQVWHLPVRDHRLWQFLALVTTSTGMLFAALAQQDICTTSPQVPARIWEHWPAILALIPAALLASKTAMPAAPSRMAALLLVAILPFYGIKAYYDLSQRGVGQALAWPVRVWQEFVGWPERDALIEKATVFRPGIPIRIGQHWYQFGKVGLWNAHPLPVRKPDRVGSVQVDVPADDVGLSGIAVRDGWVQLHIAVARDANSPDQLDDGSYLRLSDEDLLVSVLVPRGRTLDRNAAQSELRRFIRAARVSPP